MTEGPHLSRPVLVDQRDDERREGVDVVRVRDTGRGPGDVHVVAAALPAGWSESHDPLFCAERYNRGPDTEEKDRGAATGRDTMTRTPEGQGAVRVI